MPASLSPDERMRSMQFTSEAPAAEPLSPESAHRGLSATTFFALAFAWSWLWWLAASVVGGPVTSRPAATLALVGGFGPLLMAILLVWRHYTPEARHEFGRRIWDPRLIPGRWWVIVVALGAGPTVVGWLATSGGELGVVSPGSGSLGVGVWLVFVAGAALVEEPGWRGYALDALLKRHTLAVTSVVLGVMWAIWHLPQFLLQGSYQHGLGLGTGPFWMFILAIVAQSFAYVWVVTNTGGSIFAAIVFHALTNLAGETLDPSSAGRLVALALWMAVAAVLVVYWRRRSGPRRAAL